jgi:hypothetical protein
MIFFDNTNFYLVNGQNGNMKSMSSVLTKPTIGTSNTESTNGGSALSTEKRAPIVMRIPKLSFLSNKVNKIYYFDDFSYPLNFYLVCSIAR